MELKPYQKRVLDDLREYLERVEETGNIAKAFSDFWKEKIGDSGELIPNLSSYKSQVNGVPHICIKVPTGGGKTFIACASIRVIFDSIRAETKAVLWLVPSLTIKDQTIQNLSNLNHPYRQKVNSQFSSKVEVYSKEQVLQGAGFNPTSVRGQLSIIIMSYDSFRARNKDSRKIYAENGQLAAFESLSDEPVEVLENTDETALIHVIRKLNPVVIVDESHNAQSELSIEMLQNVNPSFILELTATPRKKSNILSYVSALELKNENMVKLPLIVYNHTDKTEVFSSAIHLQKKLEESANEEEKISGKYIRPIVLLQAQSNRNEDSIHFKKIKEKLLEMKVPEEQIKIKTADINEIKGIDLLSKKCPVRFIITVDALKEGWDCPFAYILASLADRNSSVAVEQVVGRILRQPYTIPHSNDILNLSYVFTASLQFQSVLDTIVKALNTAGFGSRDFRYEEMQPVISDAPQNNTAVQQPLSFSGAEDSEYLNDVDAQKAVLADEKSLNYIIETAKNQSADYVKKSAESKDSDTEYLPDEIRKEIKQVEMVPQFRDRLIDTKLPRFYKKENVGLFGNSDILFTKENLLQGFELSKSDTNINFDEVETEAYQVDTVKTDEDYSVKYMKLEKRSLAALKDMLFSLPKESRIRELTANMKGLLGQIHHIADRELDKYLERIFDSFSAEQVSDCLDRPHYYKERIKKKIDRLCSQYAEKEFSRAVDSNKIFLKYDYRFPVHQMNGDVESTGIIKSLYPKEFRMNEFEKKAINQIANLDNVIFWTKNPEKKGFCINGFINHYPDFIAVLRSGRILVVETKGDFLDNSDSIMKLKLGKIWANKSGDNFRYFMLFENNGLDGAYSLADGKAVISEL